MLAILIGVSLCCHSRSASKSDCLGLIKLIGVEAMAEFCDGSERVHHYDLRLTWENQSDGEVTIAGDARSSATFWGDWSRTVCAIQLPGLDRQTGCESDWDICAEVQPINVRGWARAPHLIAIDGHHPASLGATLGATSKPTML